MNSDTRVSTKHYPDALALARYLHGRQHLIKLCTASWARPTGYTFALGQVIGTVIYFAVNMYVLSYDHQMHWRRPWPDFTAWGFPVTVVGLLCWLLRQKLPPLSQPLALAASAVPFLLLVLVIHQTRYKRLFTREGFFTLQLEKRRDTA